MKKNTEALKNKLKQPRIILFLVTEILINVMLYYPLTFAYDLAKGAETGFQLIYLVAYMPIITAVFGVLALFSEKSGLRAFFSSLFFGGSLLIVYYVILNYFQSWFGWLLVVLIVCGYLLIFFNLKNNGEAAIKNESNE